MALGCVGSLPSASAREVRVATFNILDGTGDVGSLEYLALQAILARMDADVVSFQELRATSFAAWSNLASELDYPYAAISGNGPLSGSLYNGYFSRFPIRSTADVVSPPGAVELTRFPFRAVIDVPDAQRPLVLWTMHHKASADNIDKFRRAIEAYRIVQDVDAYLAANPDHVEYVLTGDMNDDVRDAQTPAQFASQPPNAPASYVLGADISFPVAYATFPVDRYAPAGAGFLPVSAFWEGTATPITRPASSRQLDYVLLSPALVSSPLGAPQGEVYYSDWDLGGGLPKWGVPLPGGTSAAASDHLPVFVDIHMADHSAVLPVAGFVSAGEVGGPFMPESQTFTLTETNSFATTWSVETDAPWLTVELESLELEPFAPQEVDVFLNENAASLPPGTYSGNVHFRNETTGLLETRGAILTVRDPLAVWPEAGLAASGIVGGPFSPAETTYVVTNKGAASASFTATATENWISVVPASWTLTGGESVAVTVGLNANANDLPIGSYTDAVVFSNQTTGLVHARPVSLAIAGTLCDAVDRCDLAWTTGGDAPWHYQATNTFDGLDAARSGPIASSQLTWLETVVTGPVQVGFRWQVSSRTNTHLLRFLDNGVARGQISGEVPWTLQTHEIAAGVHTLRWAYATSSTAPLGANAAGVDQVTLDYLAVSPATSWFASGEPGGPFSPAARTYVVTNSGSEVLSWSAAADVAWITPASAGGELAPGASATVAFALDTNAAPAAPGTYPAMLLFSNETTGIVLERPVVLSTMGALCEAVEGCDFVWTTGGNTNWFRQTTHTADGVDAAQSGPLAPSQQSWIETTVTGPAVLRFQWRVSSRTNYHLLRFQIDGTNQASISGLTPWMQRTQAIAAGTHVLRWVFTNTSTSAQNANAGWLDQIALDTLAVSPSNAWYASGPAGGAFAPDLRTYVLTNSGGATLSWAAAANVDWLAVDPASGELPPGAGIEIEVALNANADLLPAGLHSGTLVFSNRTAGGTSERAAQLDTRGSLCDAVDQCALDWSAGGHGPWFFQTASSTDGVDAAQSGPLTTNQQAWLETAIDGPVQISFHWRASSLTNSHYLRFLADGAVQALLSGETEWGRRSYEVPPGRHVLRWTFTNNATAPAGANAAWFDQVSLDYLSALPMDVWSAVGPAGGPFAPGTRTYVLTNSGTETLAWSATPSANWLTVAPAAGEIEPGEGVVIEMSINANADALGLGTRAAAVAFSNLTTGVSFQRAASLTVLDALIVTPSSSASHTGFVGGPYSPATRTFALSNGSPTALAWSVLVQPEGWPVTTRTNWVTSEPAAGFLEPGAVQDVVVSFNENTAGLSAAMHYARLTFSNETSALAQNRYLYLTLQEPLAVSGAAWAAIGPAGGPFAPTSAVYVLTNRSPIAQSWTVATDADWIALGSAGGTLASSSSVAVAAQFNAQALALPAGGHSAALAFSNQTQGSVLTQTVSLAVGVEFCDAVEACGAGWTFGGTAPWLYQTAVSKDGLDAAASGAIADSQESWMQTAVAGPGTLTFWWKVSSEANYDYLEFWLDGILTNRISGEADWQQPTYALGSGAHVLRWRYVKDSSVSSGSDRAWVDLVAWTAARTAMGVPVEWYQRFGLAPGAAETWDDLDWRPAASGDPNWFQYVSGLTPTNAADAFRILDVRQAVGQPTRLEWWGGTNGPAAPYVVQSATALEPAAWAPVGASPRTAGLNVWTNAEPADACRYYRILAEPDPAP
ncbi:MAG: endonuclease/exonuclease/phosphatase family protein [Kiritimatiellia bacterium]